MKTLLIGLLLLLGQINTLQQEKPVVHLEVHQKAIPAEFGGELLELINSPPVISLPLVVPKLDSLGAPWSVDVKNMGPHPVTIIGKGQFSQPVNVGQTIRVYSHGTVYSLKR